MLLCSDGTCAASARRRASAALENDGSEARPRLAGRPTLLPSRRSPPLKEATLPKEVDLWRRVMHAWVVM